MATVEKNVATSGNAAGGTVVPAATGEGKKKKGGKRNKPTKPVHPRPMVSDKDGKLVPGKYPDVASAQAGFDVSRMAMLKEVDFVDCQHYAEWKVWYYKERVRIAESELATIAALGSTAEERSANRQKARVLDAVERMIEAAKGAPPSAAKSKMQERIKALFASVQEI